MEKHNSFLADSRGQYNVFTVISVLAGLTVVLLPWAIVWRNYPNPERLNTAIYANFLLVAACILTDAALGAVIERGLWVPVAPAAATPDYPAAPLPETPNIP